MSEKIYFNKHWKSYNHEIPEQKLKVAEDFLLPLIKSFKAKKNKKSLKVLDVGCGDGVHYRVIRDLNLQIDFYGVDISNKVITNLKKIYYKKKANFKVADTLNLPIKDETFDAVFSFGVLGYTQNPIKGFLEKARVLKKGGKIGVWLYPNKPVSGILFKFIRFMASNSNEFIRDKLADLIVPFLYFLPTRSGLNLSNATFAQCKEVVMVNLAPDNLLFFKKEDVIKWFVDNNFKIDFDDKKNPITIWGTKF